ncbi:hypothetical protein UF75_2289 [Desulfosporosinus sp. I2]|nr:hypothetical protein UF75_2289 [Desulfosporosinus sp. I2]
MFRDIIRAKMWFENCQGSIIKTMTFSQRERESRVRRAVVPQGKTAFLKVGSAFIGNS